MSRTAWSRKPPDFYWKQNDTAPAIAEQLLDGNGSPVLLSGAAVKFLAWLPGSSGASINAAATITDAATGKVAYTPTALDTSTPGDLMAEWQVTFSGGAIESFPNWGYQKVRITDDVGS